MRANREYSSNSADDSDDQERLELESSPLEVSYHRAHYVEHDEREQPAVDCVGGCFSDWAPGGRQVVRRAIEHNPRDDQEHNRHGVVDEVLTDPDQAYVRRASKQALAEQLIGSLERKAARTPWRRTRPVQLN